MAGKKRMNRQKERMVVVRKGWTDRERGGKGGGYVKDEQTEREGGKGGGIRKG